MADLKISALTASSTPLAGTEVLPIVQSSATVKVAVSNLTAGRNVSMSGGTVTSGGAIRSYRPDNAIYTDQSMAAGSGGGYIFNNANGDGFKWQFAGTDQFLIDSSGNAKVSLGNLVQGTAAKGVNFTANTPQAGMTSQLLNWFEEGTFTPTIDGSTSAGTGTYTAQSGRYTRIGNRVIFSAVVTWTAHTGTGPMRLGNLPFTANASANDSLVMIPDGITLTASNTLTSGQIIGGTKQAYLFQCPVGGGVLGVVAMDTNASLYVSGSYTV
jgi:hypothetical protein